MNQVTDTTSELRLLAVPLSLAYKLNGALGPRAHAERRSLVDKANALLEHLARLGVDEETPEKADKEAWDMLRN